MSEISRLFAKAPNSHSQTDLAEVFNFMVSNGYKRNFGDDLEVVESSPAGMSVLLQTGKAFIEGYYYYNDADKTVNIDAADAALNRIDRIVLECDALTDLEIVVKVSKGVAAAVPVAPALTRAGGIYEISLAQVYVGAGVVAIYNTNITDERDDPTLCGVAQGLAVAKVSQLHSETLPLLNGAVTAAGKPNHGTGYGACNVDDDVYFAGGNGGGSVLVSRYRDDTWTALTVTPARCDIAALTHYNGKLYMCGQYQNVTYVATTRIYDIATNAWSTGLDRPTVMARSAQVELGGKIYCFGGITTAGAYSVKLEIYDIAGNTWAAGANLPSTPTAVPLSATTDGTDIYVMYVDAGGTKFYRYVVSTDSYVAKTSPVLPGTTYGYLFYKFGYIWAATDVYFRYYNITTNTWTTLQTATGLSGLGYPVAMTDSGVCIDNSKIYTYYYHLGDASAEYILGFRKRTNSKLGLINGETLTTGVDTVCVTVDDPYGIYINDTTLTGTYEVEIYG
jgi:hypothetical protein